MNGRSVALLLVLAFAGGVAGFAWLSSSSDVPWISESATADPMLPEVPVDEADIPVTSAFAVPTIIQPSASQAEAMLLVHKARRALEAGKPLGELGSRLQVTFGASQPAAIATVANGARQPISNAELLARFDAIAPQLQLPSGTTWDRLRYEFNTLFVLRAHDAPPTVSAARIARVRQLIIAGDIATAARQVRALPGASSATNWLADASRAIAVHRALDQLQQLAAAPPPVPLIATEPQSVEETAPAPVTESE